MEIKPIERSNLPDKIIEQIKNIIIEGRIQLGDQLPSERELAEKFSVGRTTVREALKALSYAGIVKKVREGTIVNRNVSNFFIDSLTQMLIMKHLDFKDLLETRKVLEVKLASFAAQRATIEDIEIIGNILKKMSTIVNQNPNEFIAEDIKFHEAIAEAAQNRVLYEIFITIRLLLRKAQEEVIKFPGIMKRSLKYHQQIFEAIKMQNVSKAERAMFDHLDDVEKALTSLEVLEIKKS